MKTTSRISQFFSYDYFEDLLAPITLAKNFLLFSCAVSKIFAIENAFAIEKSIFALRNWKKLFITSPYHNNSAQKLDFRNRLNVLCKFSVFAEKYFTNFFPKVNSLKAYCAYFSFGQVEIFSGKQTFDITCPTDKLWKKLISIPDINWSVKKRLCKRRETEVFQT